MSDKEISTTTEDSTNRVIREDSANENFSKNSPKGSSQPKRPDTPPPSMDDE